MQISFGIVDHRRAYMLWRKHRNWTLVKEEDPELPSKASLSKWSKEYKCPHPGCIWHNYAYLDRVIDRAGQRIAEIACMRADQRKKLFEDITGAQLAEVEEDVDPMELALYEVIRKDKPLSVDAMLVGRSSVMRNADELSLDSLRSLVVDHLKQAQDLDITWRLVMSWITNREDPQLERYLASRGNPKLTDPLEFKSLDAAIKALDTLVKNKLLLEGKPTSIDLDIVDMSSMEVLQLQNLMDYISHMKDVTPVQPEMIPVISVEDE